MDSFILLMHQNTMTQLAAVRAASYSSDAERMRVLGMHRRFAGPVTVVRRHRVADLRIRAEWMAAARRTAAAAGRANDEGFIAKLYKQFTFRH
jgi:hypothetical protein